MLARARLQSRWLRRFERVRADAYALPFRDGSFDLVFSSLMLQWCDDLDAVFAEIARVLKPGGVLLFSTFGPGTLAELREAWSASDAPGNHVNHFFDPHALGSALMHAGLAEPVLDVDRTVIDYPDVLTLMRELKAIGAHNVTRGRARGLTGRKRLAAMTQAYETQRRDGKLPATYEVIHAICWGAERRAQEHEASARDVHRPGRHSQARPAMNAEAGKQGFFITGTDTGVGKTLVTVALTRALVARGLRTAVMKPVAAGAMQTPDGPRNDDALELLAASNVKAAYEDVNPWLLTTAGIAASGRASRRHFDRPREDRHRVSQARRGCRTWCWSKAPADGSRRFPATATMADIAEKLALPVIFVVGMRLGCLNHALLTREAIRSYGLPFAGWIANKMHSEMALADANIDTLASRFGVPPLGIVPRVTGPAGNRQAVAGVGSRGRKKARKPLSAPAKSLV